MPSVVFILSEDILFYFIIFYSFLFYSILFYLVLYRLFLFFFLLFSSISFCSIPFNSIFHYLFWPFLFSSDLFCFLLFFYREPKMGNKDLTVSSFRQMCGRAGMLRLTHLIPAECFTIRTVLFSSIAIISYSSILMSIFSSIHCGLLLLPSHVFYIFILLISLDVSTYNL